VDSSRMTTIFWGIRALVKLKQKPGWTHLMGREEKKTEPFNLPITQTK